MVPLIGAKMSEAALTLSTAPIWSIIFTQHLVAIVEEARRTSLANILAFDGQLDKDDVSERILGIVRDAHSCEVGTVSNRDPFVCFSIPFGCAEGSYQIHNFSVGDTALAAARRAVEADKSLVEL